MGKPSADEHREMGLILGRPTMQTNGKEKICKVMNYQNSKNYVRSDYTVI